MTRSTSYRRYFNTAVATAPSSPAIVTNWPNWARTFHSAGAATVATSPTAQMLAAYATHLNCWRSSPRARRRRITRALTASTVQPSCPIVATPRTTASASPAAANPTGFSSIGAVTSGPGVKPKARNASSRVPASAHRTIAQRRPGSLPSGKNRMIGTITAIHAASKLPIQATHAAPGGGDPGWASTDPFAYSDASIEQAIMSPARVHSQPIGLWGLRVAMSTPMLPNVRYVSAHDSTRKVAPAPATDSLPLDGGNPLAAHRSPAATITVRIRAQSAHATRIAVRVPMDRGLLARHYAAYAGAVPLRVVLAEDNLLVREGVQRLLDAQPG